MKVIALGLIRWYQKYLSLDSAPWSRKLFKHTSPILCKFHPTCSEYTYQAIEKYGIVKGVVLGAYRILRCSPLTKGGYDPVK